MNNYEFNTIYKKSMGRSFLCIEPFLTLFNCDNKNEPCYKEDFRTKMVRYNSITSLLPLHLQLTNAIPSYCYDITGLQSLEILCENKRLSYTDLCHIVLGIYHALMSCEKFMLKTEHLIFSSEYIFLSTDFSKIGLCYFPLIDNNMTQSLCSLFEYLLKKIDHKDEKCVFLAYSLHNECIKGQITTETLLTYISTDTSDNINPTNTNYHKHNEEILLEPTEVSLSALTTNPISIPTSSKTKLLILSGCSLVAFISLILLFCFDIINSSLFVIFLLALLFVIGYNAYNIYKDAEGPLRPIINPDKSNLDLIDFDDHVGIEDTILLSSPENSDFHSLIYTGTDSKENILLTNYPFTIGKSNSCNHILSNSIISRLHAKVSCIPTEDNTLEYFIEDLNSTNGTFVNKKPLTPYEKYTIHFGDYISFGHLTYIFR